MKKEARLLLEKAFNSLILGIEYFNRPTDRGRSDSVLIFINHSFEMFLKAAILHKGGKIREKRAKQTIGFDDSVRKSLSDGKIKFLNKEQALTLQAINSLRDAAQHHLVDLSEHHLYLHAQSALTLFKDLLKLVFGQDLRDHFPERVLPISTLPPTDISSLFESETSNIKALLKPQGRKRIEALAKLRGLAVLEGATEGERIQPGVGDLKKLAARIQAGESWNQIFPGVASLEFTTKGHGPSLDLRITKKEGIPVHLVHEGTPGAGVVAIKRVDDLGFYNMNLTQLAENIKMSSPKVLAMVRYLNLQASSDYFKQIIIGKSKFNRYSQKALDEIKKSIEVVDLNKIWETYGKKRRKT